MSRRQIAPMALASRLPQLHHLAPEQDLPCFELTYLCDGRTFKALARGRNATAAGNEGLIALADKCPDFNPETARIMAAVQVR